MNAVAEFPALPTTRDGYANYVSVAESIPPLGEDEERQLVNNYRQDGDIVAARQLALSHLRLVVSIARGYHGYGLEQGDLVQEGSIGLLKAIKKFDLSYGARLATFATYWIRAEIHSFIIRNWRIVKIATTKSQRKLFFNMRKLFEQNDSGKLKNAAAVAKDLDVKEKDIHDMRARVQNTNCVALSTEKDGDANGTELILEAAETTNPETVLLNKQSAESRSNGLSRAIDSLDERGQTIIHARRLQEPPLTLHALAQQFNISAERVRQLEEQAMKKIRQYLTA